jgi:hypothetical protein
MKFLCHFKIDLLVGVSTLNLCLKASCTVTARFYEIPARISRVALKWAPSCISLPSGGRRETFLQLMYLQSHIYKNILVCFDFVTTWNQGVLLCSPCILGVKEAGALGWNLSTFMCQFCRNAGSLNILEPSGPAQACTGIASPTSTEVRTE